MASCPRRTPPRTLRRRLLAVVVALAATGVADATQHLVRAGDDWSKLTERLQPGDEIILMPGNHRGARLEGVAGTADKPVVIRPADVRSPVRIDADEIGIHLIRPKHVRIEAVVVVGAKRAGVIIEGAADAPAESIDLKSVYVANTGDRGEKDAIRVVHAKEVSIDTCRVESWHRAGVHVHASEGVTIRQCEIIAGARTPDRMGIAIDGASRDVIVERTRFGQGQVIAVAIGLPESDSVPPLPPATAGSPPPALADSVVVERCLSERPERFVAFGSCRATTVRANTIVSPTALWEVAAVPKGWSPPNATVVSNLTVWEPATLRRFALAAPGSEPAGIAVEVNLWWSAELAATRSMLGDFVGSVHADQVTTVDPRLDTLFNPRTEAARAFGREAP